MPTRRAPLVNKSLVGLNILVFLYELSLAAPSDLVEFYHRFGLVPEVFFEAEGLLQRWTPVFTSMFVHGGWLHVGSNMLYLWIFGDNVEDCLGRGRYLLFYLLAGLAAALVQLLAQPTSPLPIVGASGAVAGVLGAYMILYPWARVLTLVPLLFFITFTEVPALLFLFFWFFLQLWNGALSLVALPAVAGGPAWWAHVGGFLAGILLLQLLRPRRPSPQPPPYG